MPSLKMKRERQPERAVRDSMDAPRTTEGSDFVGESQRGACWWVRRPASHLKAVALVALWAMGCIGDPEEAARHEAALAENRVPDPDPIPSGGSTTPSAQPHQATRGEIVEVLRAARCQNASGACNPQLLNQAFSNLDINKARRIAYTIQRPPSKIRNIVILSTGHQDDRGFVGAVTGQGDDWRMPNSEWSAQAVSLQRDSNAASAFRYVHVDSMWSQLRHDPPPELPPSSTLYISFWDPHFTWLNSETHRSAMLNATINFVLHEVAMSQAAPGEIQRIMVAGSSRGAVFTMRLIPQLLQSFQNAELYGAHFEPVVAPNSLINPLGDDAWWTTGTTTIVASHFAGPYVTELPSNSGYSWFNGSTERNPRTPLYGSTSPLSNPYNEEDKSNWMPFLLIDLTPEQRSRVSVHFWSHGVLVSEFDLNTRAIMSAPAFVGGRTWLHPHWSNANDTVSGALANYCGTDTISSNNEHKQRARRVHAGVPCVERDDALARVSTAFREAGVSQVTMGRVGHTSTDSMSLSCQDPAALTLGSSSYTLSGWRLNGSARCSPTRVMSVTCTAGAGQRVVGVRRQGLRVAAPSSLTASSFATSFANLPDLSGIRVDCEFARIAVDGASGVLQSSSAPSLDHGF